MKYCCTLLFCLLAVFTRAQSLTIRVVDTRNQPLAYVSLRLVVTTDTLQQQYRITDSSGSAVFNLQPENTYQLAASLVGYAALHRKVGPAESRSNLLLTLVPEARALSGITLNATRPLIRQEDDKTIVDPEPLAQASTNAYEILEKTPGVFADGDGNIFLSSTTPAIIYINGREQRMSAADVATLLKSLPPNAIASIEILRTPSARYDASGGGGIVNIILKKGVRIGMTGSITLGGNQGRYGNQFAGATLNNTRGKWSSYANLQYNRRNNYEKLSTDRLLGADTLLRQDARTLYPASSVYTSVGTTYAPNKSWDLTLEGRATWNVSDNQSTNLSAIRVRSNDKLLSENIARVGTANRGLVWVGSLSARRKGRREGNEWTTDLSHTSLPSRMEQNFRTIYLLPQLPPLPARGHQTRAVQQLQAQTNWTYKLPAAIKMETGIKTTNTWLRSDADFTFQVNGQTVADPVRTNRYVYEEHIHAAFLQASRSFGSIVVKTGVRAEHTRMSGTQQLPNDTTFNIRRTDPFPYLYISRNLVRIAGYDLRGYLVYRRTIARPAYENLNPAPRVIDPYLFEAGNPALRPQFNQNFEANISFDEKPVVAIGINRTRDIFTQVLYQADTSSAVTYRTFDNLGANREFYFRALGALPPGKRYFFVAGLQYNHNNYQGLYESKPLAFSRGSWTVFTFHSFKIDKNTTLNMNGFARFKGQLQFYELSSFGALNFSLNRQLLERKLNVGVSVNDVFFTNNNSFTLMQGSINARGSRQNDTRRVGINLRYNFGMRRKEDNNLLHLMSNEPTGTAN